MKRYFLAAPFPSSLRFATFQGVAGRPRLRCTRCRSKLGPAFSSVLVPAPEPSSPFCISALADFCIYAFPHFSICRFADFRTSPFPDFSIPLFARFIISVFAGFRISLFLHLGLRHPLLPCCVPCVTVLYFRFYVFPHLLTSVFVHFRICGFLYFRICAFLYFSI